MALTEGEARTWAGTPPDEGVGGPDLSAYLTETGPGGRRLDLLVSGAHCAACIARIEGELAGTPGVASARLNLSTGRLAVGLEPEGDPGQVVRALDRIGYPATPYDPDSARQAQDREGRELAMALAVAGFGAGNAMIFSVPVWAGLFGQELGPATRTFMQWASAGVGAPCAVFAGMVFFRSAWKALRAGRANMDVPISIGVILTLVVSFQETLLMGRDTYFDAAVTLLFLLLIGRWMDHALRRRARSAAADLLALQAPSAVLLAEDGTERMSPLRLVRPGDRLRVRPGERVPVDGVVETGESEIDNALLTGETTPQPVHPGVTCRAGALNLTGLLTLRAEAACEDSTLARIARLVESGAQSRSTYVQLADKAAAIYVPVVHTAAALTCVIAWMLGIPVREAVLRAATVLIVTCPCALGLAVPAVQVAAASRLFRRGVLVKSGAGLERLAEADHVAFDKTGVLTEGRPRLLNADPADIARAAPLARASSHPLARALAEAAGEGPAATGAIEIAGQGIEARATTGLMRLGRAAFVGAPLSGNQTELWFRDADGALFRFAFADALRPEAVGLAAALAGRGLSASILSGDVEAATLRVAGRMGIPDWRAGLTPQGKVEALDDLKAAGRRVLMVGDGLNDVAALSHAHVSMAPGTALDASQSAADLVYPADHPERIAEAIDTARAARRRAMENFAFAALYNLVAGPAAMLGFVNPFVAALAMSGSSLVVTLNALRLLNGGGR
ncbi:heavy metal translocating P-type ATPase [Phenylobacterium sp.]|uniref:heavy metal translocating P-type ATPase n=1 Tax=Phenylobacterium sp. TaxID=1871053 RepID=UPI0025F3B206|nr:heavy metal translocating P-type ATPase [Phenylobacterium sp.]MCA6285306.1 cadmium-translocating P-type ATPase [Phenylobacterium sp.]MCA6289248.1 cadmium-translocating P-type ATPase [Phenylobacterium sp.]MCA6309548.1 cadmium-translocating P-type ATPase [Phenylobacterium sp.]MCA6323051.1 cadmium-translocating P-type ATPase [Phenylobacterium sp.]MCA6337525.1 cadmium-translocating P-type ATPase [Phenylobacterium sp.]